MTPGICELLFLTLFFFVLATLSGSVSRRDGRKNHCSPMFPFSKQLATELETTGKKASLFSKVLAKFS